MITLIYLIDKYHWHLAFGIPLALVLPITILIACLHYAGKRWMAWVYMRVADVLEFEKASQMSGFGAYSVDDIKDEQIRMIVKDRFTDYRFEDDYTVSEQTIIYFRRPYQNPFFLLMFGGLILTTIPFVMFPTFCVQLIIPLFFCVILFIIYYNSSDRTPQLILSENGIESRGKLAGWEEISSYEVIQGKTSYLRYTHKWIQENIEIDNLMIGRWRLNHLLHIYSNRHKLASVKNSR